MLSICVVSKLFALRNGVERLELSKWCLFKEEISVDVAVTKADDEVVWVVHVIKVSSFSFLSFSRFS